MPNQEKLSPDALALIGWDDGPPEKGNAVPAGNRDGGKQDAIGHGKNSSGRREDIQARIDALIGDSDPSDSPLDVVVKMTEFPDISGSRAKPLTISMRDLYDEIEHWRGPTKEALPLIVGGEFGKERSPDGSLRHAANRKNVTVVVIDYDGEEISFAEARDEIEAAGVAAVGFTTPSHTEDAPRHRWLFPLSRPHSPDEIIELTERANTFLDGMAAEESGRIAQSFYIGWATSKPRVQRALVSGSFLDTRDDIEPVPLIGKPSKRHADRAEDPTSKRGVIGAWCRAHDVPDVIAEFLPGVYEKRGKRYRYRDGSSKTAGLAVYDAGAFAYSNHGSDPCGGRLVNSFDLVRLHKFGHLDEGLAPDVAMTDRPSYKAMIEFARRDPAVAAELEREEAAIVDEFDVEEVAPFDEDFLFADQWSVGRADRYVVKGMIGEGDLGSIFGPPGSGKSVIAPYIAHQVAKGEPVFGMRTREAKVLYVSGEDGLGIVGRFLGLGRQENIGITTKLTNLNPGSPDLGKLRKMVAKYKPGLVFIDTLAACFPGLEENSSEGMGRAVSAARSLTKLGAAVVLIHHSTKASDGTPRGHSILNGALDFSLEVLPKGDDGVIRGAMRKNRNGACDAVAIAFRIIGEDMGVDSDGDRITVPVCLPLDGPAPKAGPKPSASEKAALDVLKSMCDRTGSVDEQEWRRACNEDRHICASDDPDSRKRTVRRVVQGLVRKRMVGLHNGRAWHSSPGDALAADEFDDERTTPRHLRTGVHELI